MSTLYLILQHFMVSDWGLRFRRGRGGGVYIGNEMFGLKINFKPSFQTITDNWCVLVQVLQGSIRRS